jgi:two-component system, response regulator, stage 0 sporulation protein F
MKKKVIYIDDEFINLELFNLNFRNLYEVFLCSRPEEAPGIISLENIRLVITDYKMPGMNGMELVDLIKSRDPDTVCMILSGYPESDVVTDKSKIAMYILKPYRREEMIRYIESCFSLLP